MDTGDEEKMKKLPGAPKRQVNNLDILCHLDVSPLLIRGTYSSEIAFSIIFVSTVDFLI